MRVRAVDVVACVGSQLKGWRAVTSRRAIVAYALEITSVQGGGLGSQDVSH